MKCQREASGALLCDSELFFQQPLSLSSPLIYPAANSEEESSVFASPVLTHTVEENCDIINIAALCQMMTLKLERCNRV